MTPAGKDFKAISDAVSNLYYRYLALVDKLVAEAPDATWVGEFSQHYSSVSAEKESWAWYEREHARLVEAHGWTVEEYQAAEDADLDAYLESLKVCSDCLKPRHEGVTCAGEVEPPIQFIDMGDEDPPEYIDI